MLLESISSSWSPRWLFATRGVYHRDLNPENILRDEVGILKVSDFGLSAIAEQIKQEGLFHTFCGTPAYVAPEILSRKGYDAAKVDIWSCGVVLFVLMADFSENDDIACLSDQKFSALDSESETRRKTTSLHRPASLNAFDIISFSRDFDLPGLFQEGLDGGTRFVSGAPMSDIISKFEEIAKILSFTVRKKDCIVSLEGSRDGVKGPLTIAAYIFDLTPSFRVVEVERKGGIE
ncbi:Non-specific serine threonine protein kinase [Orobanche gracilis]